MTDVALLTEGTYPYQFGGVSVWCDQLVRGLPDYTYRVVALVATGVEPQVWALPDNVASVVTLPLWGTPPPGSRVSRRDRAEARRLLSPLLDTLLDPSDGAQLRFADVMRELAEYGRSRSLTAAFASEEAVRLLSDAWRERGPGVPTSGSAASDPAPSSAMPTVHDALVGLQLLEHALRPFAHPPVRADVLHAVTNGLGVLPALTSTWRYGTPMLVTEHGIYLREQYLHSRQGPYRWPVRALYLSFIRRLCTLGYQAAEIVTPGNVYNRRWEERLGAQPSRIRTIHNGVDPGEFPVLLDEPEQPTISWVGRVDPVKDLETLLRAFALLHREMPATRLRMFGSPPPGRQAYLERCRRLATDLGIGDAATFEGRAESVRDAYAAGHVVVLCSISEGLPYSVIEAMTCGRACVATDVGGVGEAVGDTGIVVPPRDPSALAHACLTLLRDPELRLRLRTAARARAMEFFTMDRAITAYDEIYEALASGMPMATQRPGVEPAASEGALVGEVMS